jgi:hypothetical protein
LQSPPALRLEWLDDTTTLQDILRTIHRLEGFLLPAVICCLQVVMLQAAAELIDRQHRDCILRAQPLRP